MTTSLDCLCGVCGPCRRADREHLRPVPAEQPVQLSARARAILDDTPYTDAFQVKAPKPPRAPRTPGVRAPRVRKPRPPVVVPDPIACIECGGLRAVIHSGKGYKHTGGDDRCEVCHDRTRFTPRLAKNETGYGEPLHPRERLRLIHALDRILVDGRAFHPDAPHGTMTGYNSYTCRCPACCEAKAHENTTRRKEHPAP